MKNHRRIKLIVASIALLKSFSAVAALGALSVQSNLGEPFSGNVVVTGEEAKVLLNGGQAKFSDGQLRGSIKKSGNNAILNIRSNRTIDDPIFIFQLGVGKQTRLYTAIIDPQGYKTNKVSKPNTSYNKPSVTLQNNSSSHELPQYGTRYRVQEGDTIINIARYICPSDMTLGQTMRAITLANAKLFGNRSNNRLLEGSILTIPTEEQLRQLAHKSRISPQHSSVGSKRKVPNSSKVVKVDTEKTDTSATSVTNDINKNIKVAPSETITQEVATKKESTSLAKENTVVQNQTVTTEYSKDPEDTTKDEKNITTASQPATQSNEVEKNVPASESVATASQPNITSSDMTNPAVSENNVIAEQENNTIETPLESETGYDLWRWILYAGIAVIVLLILLMLLRKKKQYTNSEKDDDVAEDIIDDNHYDINIYDDIHTDNSINTFKNSEQVDSSYLQKEEKPTLTTDDLGLDLDNIDKQQTGILSSAVTNDKETEKRKSVDWDKIESTESVYEPESSHKISQNKHHNMTNAQQPAITKEKDPIASEEPIKVDAVANSYDSPDMEYDFVPLSFDDSSASETHSITPLQESNILDSGKLDNSSNNELLWSGSLEQDINNTDQSMENNLDQDLNQASTNKINLNTETTINWQDFNNLDTKNNNQFISESVGMEAPLEAKYDLAEMYVEIGDPGAAKETLRELIEESSGEILEKAKTMLSNLEK